MEEEMENSQTSYSERKLAEMINNDIGLSSEEKSAILSSPVSMMLYKKLSKRLEEQEIDTKKLENSLFETQSLLDEALLNTNNKPMESSNKEDKKFENLYYGLRREHDSLVLLTVKLKTQIESMKKTNSIANSIGTNINNNNNNNNDNQNSDVIVEDTQVPKDIDDSGDLDINALLEDLSKKMQLNENEEIEKEVMLDFLLKLQAQKKGEFDQIQNQIKIIDKDIKDIESKLNRAQKGRRPKSPQKISSPTKMSGNKRLRESADSSQHVNVKKKLFEHFDDIKNTYFQTRLSDDPNTTLDSFSTKLSMYAKYSCFSPVASFGYFAQTPDKITNNNLVSSIALDKDEGCFAVGGTLKEIQLFPYNEDSLIHNMDDDDELAPLHYITTSNKITSLSWSKFSSGQLAGADYNGLISIWDANAGSLLLELAGHTHRSWSVDYSHQEPGILASASEDYTVKIWDVNHPKAIGNITAPAANCAVKFNPVIPHQLVFGCANNLAYYYDTRKLDAPLYILNSHSKSVSAVSFLNRKEFITQSIDGTIKLWDTENPSAPIRTYSGHKNEKFFVGLQSFNDRIACGSEDNTVYIYNRDLSVPIVKHSFDIGSVEKDASKFISSVCWNKFANFLIAGNSGGLMQILRLQ